MSLRYLLDENIDPLFRVQLLRKEPGLTVWMIGDPGAPKKGTSDPDILCWCEDQDFILITGNRKSMPGHLADHLSLGRHIPGILTINPDLSPGATIEELILLALASFADEFQDSIVYLPLTQ